MAVRQVLQMGDPRLLETASPVATLDTPELHELVKDLIDTMEALDGAGLAAPQIGVGLRVVVFELDNNPRYPNVPPVPRTLLVNPVLEPLSEEVNEDWEGCLSVTGLRGVVPRYTHVRYSGFDLAGNSIVREVSGFHARVVQHECDHLDGILYPQRMLDMKQFGFSDVLAATGNTGVMPCDT
ncbi:MAG: peptide deformylase [Gammaproteobacteria bacterium]|nr:peptide deformylase [Gammaproteobacteria bacterium]